MASAKIEELAMSAKSPPPAKSPLVIARSDPRADLDKMASYLRSNRSHQSKELRTNGGHVVEDFFDASDRQELGHDFLAAALDHVAKANEEVRVLEFAAKWSIDEVNGKFPNVMDITDINTAFGGENVTTFGSAFLELALKFIKGAFKQTVDDYNEGEGRLAAKQRASSGSVTNSPEDQRKPLPENMEKKEAAFSTSRHETTVSTPGRSEGSAKEADRAVHLSNTDQTEHQGRDNTPGWAIRELPSARYRSVRNNQKDEPKPHMPPAMQRRLPHRDASGLSVTTMNEPAPAVVAAPSLAPGRGDRGDRAAYGVQTLPVLKDPVLPVPVALRPPTLAFPTTGMPMQMAPMADQIVAAGVYPGYGNAYPHMFVGPAFQPGSQMLGPQLQHPYFGNQPGLRNRVYEEPRSLETPPRRDSFSSAQRGQRRQSSSSQTGLHSSAHYRGNGTNYAPRIRRDAEESYMDRALEGQPGRQPRLSFSSNGARSGRADGPFVHQVAEVLAEQSHPDDMCDEHHIGRNRTEVTELYVKGVPQKATQAQISRAIAEQVGVPVKEIYFSPSKYANSHVVFAHFHNNADTRAALGVGLITIGDRTLELTVPWSYHGPPRRYPTLVNDPRSHVTPRGPAAYVEPQARTEAGYGSGSPYTSRRFSEPARHGPVYVSQSMREQYLKDRHLPTQGEVIEEGEEAQGTYSSQDARSSPRKSRMTSFGSSFGEGVRSPQKRRTGSSSQGFASRRASNVQDSDVSRNQKSSKQQDRHKGNAPVSASPEKELSGMRTPYTDRLSSGSYDREDQRPSKRLGRYQEGTSLSSHVTAKPIDAERTASPSTDLVVDAKNGEISKPHSGQEQQLIMPLDLPERPAESQSPHNDPISGKDDRVSVAASSDEQAALIPASQSTPPQFPLFESNALQVPATESGPTSAFSDDPALAGAVGPAQNMLAHTRSDDLPALTDDAKIGGALPLVSGPDTSVSLLVSHLEAGIPSKLEKGKDKGKTESLVPQSMRSKKTKSKRQAKAKAKLQQQHSNTPSEGSQPGVQKETQLSVKVDKQSAADDNLSEQSKQTSEHGGSTLPNTQQHSSSTDLKSDTAANTSEMEQIQHMSTSDLEQTTMEEPQTLPVTDIQSTEVKDQSDQVPINAYPEEKVQEWSTVTDGQGTEVKDQSDQVPVNAVPEEKVQESSAVTDVQSTEVKDQSDQLPITPLPEERVQKPSGFVIATQSREVPKPESDGLSPPENVNETGASSKVDDPQSGRTDEVPKKKKKNKSKKKPKAQNLPLSTVNGGGTMPLPDSDMIESVPTQEARAPESTEQSLPSGNIEKTVNQERPRLCTPIIILDTYLKTKAILDEAIDSRHKAQPDSSQSNRWDPPQATGMRGSVQSSPQQHATRHSVDNDSEAGRQKFETSSEGRKADAEVEVASHQATCVVEASAAAVPLDRDDVERKGARDEPETLLQRLAHWAGAAFVDPLVAQAMSTIRGGGTDDESVGESHSEDHSSDIDISQSAVGTTGHGLAHGTEMQQVGDRSERGEGDEAGRTSTAEQNMPEISPKSTTGRQSDDPVTKEIPVPKLSWATVASGGPKFNTQSGKAAPSQGKAVAVHGSVPLSRDKDGTGKALSTAQADPWLATEAPWTDRAKTAVLADRVRNDTRVAVPRISFPKKEGKSAGAGKDEDSAGEPVRTQQPMARGKENRCGVEDNQKDDTSIYQRITDGTFTKGG